MQHGIPFLQRSQRTRTGQLPSSRRREHAHARQPDAGRELQGSDPGPLLQRGPHGSRAERPVDGHRRAAGQGSPTGGAHRADASQVAHDSLTLTWNDPQEAGITGYRVLRGTDAGRPIHDRGGHGKRRHGVHGHHRGGGDHLLLRGPGPERGRLRCAVHRHQRHHAGSARRFKRRYAGSESGACPNAHARRRPPLPAIAMVVPSDALTDRMTQLEVNLTNLPAGRYNVRVTVTNDVADEGGRARRRCPSYPSPRSLRSSRQLKATTPCCRLTRWASSQSLRAHRPSPRRARGFDQLDRRGRKRGFLLSGTRINHRLPKRLLGGDQHRRPRHLVPGPRRCSGRTYRYRVQAKYANTRSHFSAFTSITTAAVAEGVPKPPSGLTVRYDVPAAAIVLS